MTYAEQKLLEDRISALEKKVKDQDRKLEILHDKLFPEFI